MQSKHVIMQKEFEPRCGGGKFMKYHFFPEDISVLDQTIGELHKKIKELGREQGEAARQSTENFGHDDACQEAIYQERQVTTSRLRSLSEVINNAVVVSPKEQISMIQLGSIVELSDGRVFRIGSYMVLANYQIKNISYDSPLGRMLLRRKEGDEIEFREQSFTIKKIS
jgi:transcription elongation GreA/GreB family factor